MEIDSMIDRVKNGLRFDGYNVTESNGDRLSVEVNGFEFVVYSNGNGTVTVRVDLGCGSGEEFNDSPSAIRAVRLLAYFACKLA